MPRRNWLWGKKRMRKTRDMASKGWLWMSSQQDHGQGAGLWGRSCRTLHSPWLAGRAFLELMCTSARHFIRLRLAAPMSSGAALLCSSQRAMPIYYALTTGKGQFSSVLGLPNTTAFDEMVLNLQAGRGFLGKGWRGKQKVLQAKLETLIQNLADELKPQSDTLLDYTFAKGVRDRLAETASRNLLGNLTGEARLWDKIVQAYQSYSGSLCNALLVSCASCISSWSLKNSGWISRQIIWLQNQSLHTVQFC